MMLRDLAGTEWVGHAELWLDPMGNETIHSECTLRIDGDAVRYAWSHEGKPQTGKLALRAGGAEFVDTWHSPTAMPCVAAPDPWSLVDVLGRYSAGGEDWGWRITLAHRPTGELVLQMTNVTPWGEEGRAVRMIATAT